MKILPRLILIAGFLSGVNAWAIDTYDSASNQLTIPTVQVGSTTYTNVVISVGNVLSIGNSPATGQVDARIQLINATPSESSILSKAISQNTSHGVL